MTFQEYFLPKPKYFSWLLIQKQRLIHVQWFLIVWFATTKKNKRVIAPTCRNRLTFISSHFSTSHSDTLIDTGPPQLLVSGFVSSSLLQWVAMRFCEMLNMAIVRACLFTFFASRRVSLSMCVSSEASSAQTIFFLLLDRCWLFCRFAMWKNGPVVDWMLYRADIKQIINSFSFLLVCFNFISSRFVFLSKSKPDRELLAQHLIVVIKCGSKSDYRLKRIIET